MLAETGAGRTRKAPRCEGADRVSSEGLGLQAGAPLSVRLLRGDLLGTAPRPRPYHPAGRGPPATMFGFPQLEARSLDGRPYLLPEDLEGFLNVLLVGLEWWQQELIDSWLPALEELTTRRTDLRIYELVVMPRS